MKHKYGYMEVPGVGYFSVPPDLYTTRDRQISTVFNEAVTREFSPVLLAELTNSGCLPTSLAQCGRRSLLVSPHVGCSKTSIIQIMAQFLLLYRLGGHQYYHFRNSSLCDLGWDHDRD